GASRAKIHRIEIEELKTAIDRARHAVEASPSSPQAWVGLGSQLRKKPDLTAAIEAYSAATRLAPANGFYRFALGAVQRDLHRWKDASASFDSVGRDETYGALAAYNLAFCARRLGDVDAETKAWSRAVSLNSRDLYAYRRLVEASKSSHAL